MNELQYLRTQVAPERGHMACVRKDCAATLDLPPGGITEPMLEDSCRRCARCLAFIVARFNAQGQAHNDRLCPFLATDDALHREALDDLDRTLALNRAAIDALEGALCVHEVERLPPGIALSSSARRAAETP